MQLATAGNLEYIGTLSLLYPQGHIGLNLLKEAVTEMAGGNELSLTAGKWAGVDTKGHGQGRLINIDSRQCPDKYTPCPPWPWSGYRHPSAPQPD